MNNVTPDTDSVKELCLKVNELAKRGATEGERAAARGRLEELLMKYDIDIEDLDDMVQRPREFPIRTKEAATILAHCIWDVVHDADIRQGERKYLTLLNAHQYIEVKEKYKHHWAQYRKEKARFITAFIIKNKIGVGGEGDGEPPSEEEMARMRVMGMAMEDNPFEDNEQIDEPTKQIET